MAKVFISSVEYYKADQGGALTHKEAIKKTLEVNEERHEYVKGLEPEKVNWMHIVAVGEADMQDGLMLWARVREAADNELESGRRAAAVTGEHAHPFALAQFLAIRDAFADQWQPKGGIESAMIDMMTIAYSRYMYWSTIAHQRATQTHN
jgi:hypothetical protein